MQIPKEFDLDPRLTMHGWNFSGEDVRQAIQNRWILNAAMHLAWNMCVLNCTHCFTEDPSNPEGLKRILEQEMSIERRLDLLDEYASLRGEARMQSINVVGAGEPTTDPGFWKILQRMQDLNIVPIIYTEGTAKLTDRKFAEDLYATGATVVLKMDSLYNAVRQNAVVTGIGKKPSSLAVNYFQTRNNVVLPLLMDVGFNSHSPTRLAFDTIVSRENVHEMEDEHRFARDNNIFILMVNYLTSGRTTIPMQNMVSRAEQFEVFRRLAEIDANEYDISHDSIYPYNGGTPCTIRHLGLYVTIKGDVFDCPGESIKLGNLKDQSLSKIWNGDVMRKIISEFDGGCFPREQFWANEKSSRKSLPVLA